MAALIQRMYALLKPGGMLLLRDYGQFDLAQFRFQDFQKMSENFYVRGDGTMAYFFERQQLQVRIDAPPMHILLPPTSPPLTTNAPSHHLLPPTHHLTTSYNQRTISPPLTTNAPPHHLLPPSHHLLPPTHHLTTSYHQCTISPPLATNAPFHQAIFQAAGFEVVQCEYKVDAKVRPRAYTSVLECTTTDLSSILTGLLLFNEDQPPARPQDDKGMDPGQV
jgi:hypothetical protein